LEVEKVQSDLSNCRIIHEISVTLGRSKRMRRTITPYGWELTPVRHWLEFFSKRSTFRPQSLPICVLLKLDLSLEQESHMASNLEQLRNEARDLYVQCNTTGEDSAVALQRSKEILLSLLLRSASERKFTQKPE